MNIFAWNIKISSQDLDKEKYDFDYIENHSDNWSKILYVFWETDLKTSKEIISKFEKIFGELEKYDISISSEDEIELIPYDYEEWIYEVASFEWEKVNFKEIKDRFIGLDTVFSIREAEISSTFWNKVIKVDFVY